MSFFFMKMTYTVIRLSDRVSLTKANLFKVLNVPLCLIPPPPPNAGYAAFYFYK